MSVAITFVTRRVITEVSNFYRQQKLSEIFQNCLFHLKEDPKLSKKGEKPISLKPTTLR